MSIPRRFKPGIASSLITLLLFPCLIGLGRWQLHRADEKAQRFHTFQTRAALPELDLPIGDSDFIALEWRRVRGAGHYVAPNILLDNRVRNHRLGYDVFTPFQFSDGSYLLVARGWVPAGVDRTDVPSLDSPHGDTPIAGFIGAAPWVGIQLPAATQTEFFKNDLVRIQRLDLPALSAELKRPLAPYVVYLEPAAPHGYDRAWPAPVRDVGKHTAYAFQWFAMAAALALIYLKINFRPD